MTLTQLFDLSFVGRRDEIGLEWNDVPYTFGDLDRRSNQVAQMLVARGFTPGDRLCVYLANSLEMMLLYLGCVKAGVIFVPVNILYRGREIEHIKSDAAPREFLQAADLEAFFADVAQQPGTRPAVALDGDSPAGIIYTSGTTGTSKGAVLTHHNFAVNALNLITGWQITAADRLLLGLPLFHVHGLGNGLHCWLISGCRMRLLERFEHQKAPAEFTSFQPTLFFGVPTIYVRLLEMPAEIARSVRLFVSGSAPLPAQTLEEFRAKFGHTILERYGMSETLMNLSNPYVGERRPGSVGLPLPGLSVRILNEQLQPVVDGETGELYLRGPNVFAGYWNRPEATAAAFVDGYFRTGDLAIRSADGYYTLCGRRSDLIISGGFNIYPREVEEFLQEQPGVVEAAVTAAPDRLRGEVPVAYFAGEASPDVLASVCREQLASFKVPRAFQRVDKLPRNAMGKVQKHLLAGKTETGNAG